MSLDDRLQDMAHPTREITTDNHRTIARNQSKEAILTDLLEITDSLQSDDGWIDKEVFKDKVRKYCE